MFGELLEELAEWSPAALDAEYRRLELEAREREARRLAVLAIIDAKGAGARDGHRSTLAYLRATTNQSHGRMTLRRARLVGAYPQVGEALMAGRFGASQVDQIARAQANPRTTESFTRAAVDWFVERGEHRRLREFATEVDNWLTMADQDGAFREEQAAVEARSAHVVASKAVGLDVVAEGGDTLTAEAMANIFKEFVGDEVEHDVAARTAEHGERASEFPLPRTVAQRRFDALKRIFLDAHAWRASGRGPAAMPDPVVNIVCDQATFHELLQQVGITLADGGTLDLDDLSRKHLKKLMAELVADPNTAFTRQIRTTSGHTVHPKQLLQAALTGWVRRVVLDARSVPIDFSEKVRCFTGLARVAATLLHQTCVHPGCNTPADQCQVDHNQAHSEGGATTQRNAQPECGPHNRFKHHHRWRTQRADNGRIYNVRPDGTLVLFVGETPPTFEQAIAHDQLQERLARLDTLRQRLVQEVA
ncbi:MAG TPA: HNH endonuclease [Ilumatobacter sp.]|nr:HNH endonuclease [Ilumatobacter sp.]